MNDPQFIAARHSAQAVVVDVSARVVVATAPDLLTAQRIAEAMSVHTSQPLLDELRNLRAEVMAARHVRTQRAAMAKEAETLLERLLKGIDRSTPRRTRIVDDEGRTIWWWGEDGCGHGEPPSAPH